MYKPIIEIATQNIHSQWVSSVDGLILKQMGEIGVNVDKDELVKALQYDRDQYDAGFADGRRAAAPKWISVKDVLPKPFQPVLCCRDVNVVDQGCLMPDGSWRIYGSCLKCVTHWMPLPEPPKEGE